MIVVQRVRVRWSAAARGASHANRRRNLDRPVAVPPADPATALVVQDVLADEATGYQLRDCRAAQAGDVGLELRPAGTALTVVRPPGRAAYPRREHSARLFTLMPGQVGRYRANFRFLTTTCCCDPSWYYESWLVHVSNGPARSFKAAPDHDTDERVHLYGG